jgi:peptidyl-prolyl cis-trans isomerase D
MSVIQKIRDKAAWFIFGAIAISLIAFILQDALYSRGGRGGWFSDNSTTVAKVNGEKIDVNTFNDKIRMQEERYRQYGMNINDVIRNNIQNQVWNSMITEVLIEQQAEKAGLSLEVNSKEFSEMLFGNNPPDFIKQLGTNQQGQFDMNQAKAQINQIKKEKTGEQAAQIQAWYDQNVVTFRNNMLQQKYFTLMGQSSYVPKWLAAKAYADNNSLSNIQYVFVPYSTISDSLKVSDADIEDYLKRNKKKYIQEEETRSLEYVYFDASPSSQDSSDIRNNLASLKPGFEATTDAKTFVTRNNSKVEFLDAYQLKSKIQIAAKDSILKLKDGEVYGPYLDANTYVLAKMIGRRMMPDSVKVRHILVATVEPQTGKEIRTDSAAKRIADSVMAVIAKGANFDSVCSKISDDKGSVEKGGVYELSSIQFGSFVKEFSEAAFYGSTGDKKVIKTQFGYHYIEVMSQKNFEEAYKIAYLAKEIFSSDETINTVQTKANTFAAESRNYKEFSENIQKKGLTKQQSEDLKQFDLFQIAGEGSRDMVRWAYSVDKGSVSDVKRIGNKFVVAALVRIKEKGLPSAADMRPKVENLVRNELKAKEIIKKIGTNNTLESIASATGQMVLKADSLSFATSVANNIGNEPKVIGAAFNKDNLGKVSTPIIGNGGVFVLKPELIYAGSNSTMTEEALRTSMRQQQRGIGYSLNEVLRKSANISDMRAKFNY